MQANRKPTNDWIENIRFENDSERDDLIAWCNSISYKRYEEYYHLLSRTKGIRRIDYKTLKAVARYDFRLSDILHSMIKFVELRFRSYLLNGYGDLTIDRKEFLYQISMTLGRGERKLDCSTYYDRKLQEKTTLGEYISVSSLETVVRLLLVLPDEELLFFDKDVERFRRSVTLIREMRNRVAHCQTLINYDIDKLNSTITALLRYMPTRESREKRIEDINNTNHLFFNVECDMEDMALEQIAIKIDEID